MIYCFPASSAFVFDAKKICKIVYFQKACSRVARMEGSVSNEQIQRVPITKGFHKSVSRRGRKFSNRRENKLCFGR